MRQLIKQGPSDVPLLSKIIETAQLLLDPEHTKGEIKVGFVGNVMSRSRLALLDSVSGSGHDEGLAGLTTSQRIRSHLMRTCTRTPCSDRQIPVFPVQPFGAGTWSMDLRIGGLCKIFVQRSGTSPSLAV